MINIEKGNIANLRYLKEKKKIICLYGAGNAGKLIGDILKICDVEIDCYIDNDKSKRGTVFDNKICYVPESIENKAECVVLISIIWVNYIKLYNQACEDGFINFFELADVLDDVLLNHKELLKPVFRALAESKVDVDIIFPRQLNYKISGLGASPVIQPRGRIAVYTGCFGNYDEVKTPKVVPENIDYYYVSDEKQENIEPYRWINAALTIPEHIKNPIMRNRYVKMHPHILFPDYDYTIYLDANLEIIDDVSGFLHENRSGISAFTHYNRDCLYYEALQIVQFQRVIWFDAYEQVIKYLDEGMPIHYGLGEMPVVAVNHKNMMSEKLLEDWWEELQKGAMRDQLCFSYIIWKNKLKMNDVTSLGNEFRKSNKFILNLHPSPSMLVGRKG